MRIFIDNADQYIQALSGSLARDPASLNAWRCIHIRPGEKATLPTVATRKGLVDNLAPRYENSEIDLIFCADHEMLIIGHEEDLSIMHAIQQYLVESYLQDEKPYILQYDLFFNWRETRKILLSKILSPATALDIEKTAEFGEAVQLQEVFDQSRKVRQVRSPLHILFVEDDEMTLRLAMSLFKNHYAVIAARDAQQAIQNYLIHAPDIVFLDLNLPDHSGFQVLKHILDNDPDAYVVMFSGDSQLDTIMQALNAGASGYVSKPFSVEKMHHYIEDCAFANKKHSG